MDGLFDGQNSLERHNSSVVKNDNAPIFTSKLMNRMPISFTHKHILCFPRHTYHRTPICWCHSIVDAFETIQDTKTFYTASPGWLFSWSTEVWGQLFVRSDEKCWVAVSELMCGSSMSLLAARSHSEWSHVSQWTGRPVFPKWLICLMNWKWLRKPFS